MTATSIDPTDDLVSVTVSGSSAHVRITVAGEVDSSSAPVLRRHIDEALDAGAAQLTVDLDRVSFLDSAGLSALAVAHRRAVRDGVLLRVLASSRAVIRPLQITGLWELLGVVQVEPGAGSAA